MKRKIFLVFLMAAIGVSIIGHQADGKELRTEKGKAGHIRIKNDSATMYADKNYLITQSRGPVGSEGIPAEIRIGDAVRVKDRGLNVKHIFWTRFLDRAQSGGKVLAEAGDVQCVLVETEKDLPYGDEERDRLWIQVKQCEVIKEIGATEGIGFKVKPDLVTALGLYSNVVGVFPKEFLRFSAIQQEAYLRGVLDGEYFLSEESKDPDRDAFVSCLNARVKKILSEAKSFVERKGEHNYLMPWTLGLLVGQSCPKETRAQDKTPPKYTEASTPTKLVFLQKQNLNETEFQRQQAIIYKAFVRGVLDGKVYILYGHNYPKLVDYLGCLSKPGNLDTIVLQRGAFTQFGENLDKSQAYGVAFTEALICKEMNE